MADLMASVFAPYIAPPIAPPRCAFCLTPLQCVDRRHWVCGDCGRDWIVGLDMLKSESRGNRGGRASPADPGWVLQ